METRDKLGTVETFSKVIKEYTEYINDDKKEIEYIQEKELLGEQAYSLPNQKVITNFNLLDINYNLRILLATYSMGADIDKIYKQYISIVSLISETWKEVIYVPMIQMLSIGILINIEKPVFDKLIGVAKKNKEHDFLIDFLIESQKKDWEIATNSFINKLPYQYTQEIIILAKSDKQAAILALKKYLTKYWYRGHNNESWYNLHKKDINSYYGYWSFESGALVKILGLDDSSLKEVQYYPYDMVHWNENNK